MALLKSNGIEVAPEGFAFVRGEDLELWACHVQKALGGEKLTDYLIGCIKNDRITFLDNPARERPLRVSVKDQARILS
ncbi:hypothetical protein [Brevundimonas vesicularis]|uniref:hypothetical protein n=1 Tax=Brevundimonas vesicularis TaxID=41276 RepID=UPI0022AC44A0|nr:hypothetical protein [Brevundimonas vesicularis]